MLQGFLMIAAMTVTAPAVSPPVQSSNGEFIFSQYPPRAKAAGEQGSVQFQAEVDSMGKVMTCRITQGSGHERLDRETCDLIVEHAKFKPTLDGRDIARPALHDGIVHWKIPGTAPAPKKVASSGKSPDEVVCKRSGKTGSLVVATRVCMTRREWSLQADKNQADWGSLQGIRGHSLCGGPGEPAC